ncbi:MAG: hypothetical protein ACE366_22600 [Bradymonadia bacterium]
MARTPVPFMAVHYSKRFVFLAPTKSAAGAHVFSLLKGRAKSETSAKAMAKYTAPLRYCPDQKVFWFTLTASGNRPRILHWAWIPEELRDQVPHEASETIFRDQWDSIICDLDPPPGQGLLKGRTEDEQWAQVLFTF